MKEREGKKEAKRKKERKRGKERQKERKKERTSLLRPGRLTQMISDMCLFELGSLRQMGLTQVACLNLGTQHK